MIRAITVRLGIVLGIAVWASLGPVGTPARADVNIIDATYGAGAGSFELGAYTGTVGYEGLAPGSTTMTGWTVGGPGDGVDWLSSPSFRADSGSKSVDLKHNTDSSISTVIPTIIGATYQLSFASASVTGDDNSGEVSAGSLVDQAFAPPFSSAYATQSYETFTFAFTATDSTTTVTFEALGHLSGPDAEYGPVVDTVSVVLSAVPEPSSVLLLGTGLFGVLLCVARRRNPAREA